MSEFQRIASVGDIPPGQARAFTLGIEQVAIFNLNGEFHAISNECPHAGGPLCEGELSGVTVECPYHGWEFDVTTGECETTPGDSVERFEVRLEGDDVLVAPRES